MHSHDQRIENNLSSDVGIAIDSKAYHSFNKYLNSDSSKNKNLK